MEVFRTLPPLADRRPCVLTIGNFDGVHLGHQAMLKQLVELARIAETSSPGSEAKLARCVLTFEPHPRDYFAALAGHDPIVRISTERDKLEALAASGVDRVCIAAFNETMARMSAQDFVREIIVEGLMAKTLMVGDDFRFGAQRQGDFTMLTELAQTYGYDLHRTPTVTIDEQRVSSSRVRAALTAGDFDQIDKLLGRRYAISGHVIHGRQLGRKLGFPTLNLRLPFPQPALAGIFVVRVFGLEQDSTGEGLPAVASLGTRPAVEHNGKYLLEVHLLDFSGDCYGKLIKVEFLSKIRDEAHYDTLEKLTQQIALDTAQARAWFEAS
ncbi:MAG: bifunctional riboflavin kinase/FAD synthetase [Burkholderiaceae bacterium]